MFCYASMTASSTCSLFSSASTASTTTPPTMPSATPTPAWGRLDAALPGKPRGTSDGGPLLRNISKPRCCHHHPTIAKPGEDQMPTKFSNSRSTLCKTRPALAFSFKPPGVCSFSNLWKVSASAVALSAAKAA